jgi:uncharacterized protein (TIGR03382 family)
MKFATMRIGLAAAALGLVLGSVEQAKAGLVTGTYNLGTTYPANGNAAQDTSGNGSGPFILSSDSSPFTFSFVNFVPDQTFNLGELTTLSLNFNTSTNSGGYNAGSPRLAIQVQDGAVEKQFLIYLGIPGSVLDDAQVDALNNVNLLGLSGNRIEVGNSGTYTTYSDVLSQFGADRVNGFTMIVDQPGISFTLNEINANAVPEPATIASAGMAALLGLGFGWRQRRRRAKVSA